MTGFPTPKTEEIYKLFRRYGLKNLQGQIAKDLQQKYKFIINDVDNVVSDRNEMAHGNHILENAPGDIMRFCKSTRKLVSLLDKALRAELSKKKCKIRKKHLATS